MKHIKVVVYAEAGEEAVVQKSEDAYEVFVYAKAKGGEANKRMISLLREAFPDASMRIVSGARSPHKIVEVG